MVAMKKIVKTSLFEDFVGSYTTRYNIEFEMYLNPTSIKRMGGWVRAISDQTGDLYVGTPSEIVHDDLLDNIEAVSWVMDDSVYEKINEILDS